MTEPWDENWGDDWQEQPEKENGNQAEPWDMNWGDSSRSTLNSEAAANNLKNLPSTRTGWIDIPAGFETVAAVGTGLANEAVRGIAGIAGTGAGAIEGAFEAVGLADDDKESPIDVGAKWLKAVPDFTYEPKTAGGQAGMEMVGKGMEKGIEGAKYAGSGYAGMGALAAGADAGEATRSMQDFRETPDALGEGTFQATGSPLAATLATLLPELASIGVPMKKVPIKRKPPNVAPDMPPSGFGGVGVADDVRAIPDAKPDVVPPGFMDEFKAAVQAGDKAKIMQMSKANPAIVAAFDELGIEFTPGMVSESMPLRQTEAALGSMPDSPIPTHHKYVESELNAKAKKLIDDAGGDPGRPSNVAANIESRYTELRSDYIAREEAIWENLNRQIPRGAEIDMRTAGYELESLAERLGKGDVDLGISRMTKHEKELWNLTHRRDRVPDPTGEPGATIEQWVYDSPPWETVDRYRRKLGMGMDSRGPFNDAEMGQLDYWYGQMAEQQTNFARGNNYEADWGSMNSLTQERKALEAAMTRTLGRQLNQSVLTRLSTATNGLLKGDIKKWDQLFDDLPANQRQAAAAQALENVFFTAGKGTKMSESFVANFKRITADPAIRERLLGDLPKESRVQFMALGNAASGFYRMMDKALSNPSGTGATNYVLSQIGDPAFMNKVLGGVADQTAGRVPIIRDWAEQMLRRTPDQKKAATNRKLQAAAELLSDPALHRAITEYAAGRVEAANKILQESQAWGKWLKQQPIAGRERLHSAGIVALFEEETE